MLIFGTTRASQIISSTPYSVNVTSLTMTSTSHTPASVTSTAHISRLWWPMSQMPQPIFSQTPTGISILATPRPRMWAPWITMDASFVGTGLARVGKYSYSVDYIVTYVTCPCICCRQVAVQVDESPTQLLSDEQKRRFKDHLHNFVSPITGQARQDERRHIVGSHCENE